MIAKAIIAVINFYIVINHHKAARHFWIVIHSSYLSLLWLLAAVTLGENLSGALTFSISVPSLLMAFLTLTLGSPYAGPVPLIHLVSEWCDISDATVLPLIWGMSKMKSHSSKTKTLQCDKTKIRVTFSEDICFCSN